MRQQFRYWSIQINSVLLALAVGYAASLATREGVATWYTTIQKPFFNPPNWVFAPVWTLLYILMGIAAGRVWALWADKPTEVRKAMLWYFVQLAVNGLWSFLFFYWHNPLLALVELLLLLSLINETRKLFAPLDRWSGLLLWPYLAWVSFAGCLNAAIWWLN